MPMDGLYSAKSQDGGAVMPMDGLADNCSMHYLHFRHPWRSYIAVPWMARSDACPGGKVSRGVGQHKVFSLRVLLW